LLIDPAWGARRISNLYRSYQAQLMDLLRKLGLSSVQALRGRKDLLRYTGGGR
jgi:glutamate synthase domain-containing protein 2